MLLLDAASQDLRYALRGLRNHKGLTIAIVATLTLGLGVNAAVFSVLDRVFVRPPSGVTAPESVRRLYVAQIEGEGEYRVRDRFNHPQWLDLRSAAPATAMTAFAVDSVRLGNGSDARRVVTTYTDSSYWSVLGVRPARGRAFTAEEAHIASPSNVVVVSDAFWRAELGGDPNVVGTPLRLGTLAYTIIGVAPRGFVGTELDATALWLPLGAMPMPGVGAEQRWHQIRGVPLLRALARTHPDSSVRVLDARLTSAFRAGSVAARNVRDSAAVVSTGPIVSAVGPSKRPQELALAARLPWVSVLVLLIACANVATLLLARAMRRQREIAVRLALGVSRRRLALQLLIESGVLALSAAAAAVVVGMWTGALLRRTLLPQIHWAEGLVDWRLAALTGGTALLAAAATALAPLAHAWRLDLLALLASGSRSGLRSAGRLHHALVVTQTAFAVTLLCGAGLGIQSLRQLLGVDVGYDADRVLIAEPRLVDPRGGEDEIPREARGVALAEAARRLRTTDRAGIDAVALASLGPMRGAILTSTRIAGMDASPTLDGQGPSVYPVSPEYAGVVGLRMLRGRWLAPEDREGAPLVAVVNETMARTVWPSGDALGQCVRVYGDGRPCYTVVGIARNARREAIIESPTMQYYVPLAQAGLAGGAGIPRALVIRHAAGGADVATAGMARVLRELVPSVEPGVLPMHAVLAGQLHPWRLGAALLSALGVLALLVALIGLYGVIALEVSRRTHEMGVRLALGAPPARIAALVVRQGIDTVAIGVALGVALTLAGGRVLSALLYDVSPYDPVVLGGAAIVMLLTALLACAGPAARATHADPAAALRAE